MNMLSETLKLEDWAEAIQQELRPLMASPLTEACAQRMISRLKDLGFCQCSESELRLYNRVSPSPIGVHEEDDIYYLVTPESAGTKSPVGVAFTSYMDRNKPWSIQFFDFDLVKRGKSNEFVNAGCVNTKR